MTNFDLCCICSTPTAGHGVFVAGLLYCRRCAEERIKYQSCSDHESLVCHAGAFRNQDSALKGKGTYGDLDLYRDRRDFQTEAKDECRDAAFYLDADAVRERLRNRARIDAALAMGGDAA